MASLSNAVGPLVIDEGNEINTVFDPVIGDFVALNYEPIQSDLNSPLGLSTGFSDVWDGPVHSEVDINMNSEEALVGIGARAKSGEITTLVMRGRRINSDGNLGNSHEYRTGSDPNHTLEVWCSAPTDYLIVGLGGRIRDGNMTQIQIWYREYDESARKLKGGVFTKTCLLSGWSISTLEKRIVSWEHHPRSEQEDLAVINGVSMRERSDDLTSLRVRFRYID